jgi:hypothetical protein
LVIIFTCTLVAYSTGKAVPEIDAPTMLTFIILPLTCLIFLTDYPDTLKGQLFRIIEFTIIYFIFEVGYNIRGIVVYNYRWNIWCSLAWNFMMFPMLVSHHKKPLNSIWSFYNGSNSNADNISY